MDSHWKVANFTKQAKQQQYDEVEGWGNTYGPYFEKLIAAQREIFQTAVLVCRSASFSFHNESAPSIEISIPNVETATTFDLLPVT